MNADEMNQILQDLRHKGELTLPYDCPPMFADPDMEITEELWNEIPWNPPYGQNTPPEADPSASDKPTYAWIIDKCEDYVAREGQLLLDLNDAAKDAITRVYGASTFQEEMIKRLSGESTQLQDDERDVLIYRCHAVEAAIAAATTKEERMDIKQIIDSGNWMTYSDA